MQLFATHFPENILTRCLNSTLLRAHDELWFDEGMIIRISLSIIVISLCACNAVFKWDCFVVTFPVYCGSIALSIVAVLYQVIEGYPSIVRIHLSSIRFALALVYVVLDYDLYIFAVFSAVIIVELCISIKQVFVDPSYSRQIPLILDLISLTFVVLSDYFNFREEGELYYQIASFLICWACGVTLIFDVFYYKTSEEDFYDDDMMQLLRFFGITVIVIANLSNALPFKIILIVIALYTIYSVSKDQEHFTRKLYQGSMNVLLNWNSIDTARTLFSGVWLFLYFNGETDTTINCILLSLIFLRGITGFRCFDASRFYVRLIIRSISDIKSFIVIFFYSTLAFGVISNSLGNNTEFPTMWIGSYDLNLGQPTHGDNLDLRYMIFLLASICNVIIMLNLLISILGDSYDRFQVSALEIDFIEMADALRETEVTMNFFRHHHSENKYLVACDFSSEQNMFNNNEWEGKILMTEKHIKAECSILKKDIARVEDSIRKVFIELEAINKKLG